MGDWRSEERVRKDIREIDEILERPGTPIDKHLELEDVRNEKAREIELTKRGERPDIADDIRSKDHLEKRAKEKRLQRERNRRC